jgi:predicted unusual protein kinase regulating ubiquinone biosynthesis (AarF/ABC1/UbiB family)
VRDAVYLYAAGKTRDNRGVSDLPNRSVQRGAKLASIPLGMAGRVVGGWGKRLSGRSTDEISAEISTKTAEQLFEVLGTLKGGAMKFGQALSVFEAAVPDELAGPYREALTKLQAAAPPMAWETVHRVLDEQLGTRWRERFVEFEEEPAAAASIGQVHHARWHDGREVAVKIQYPGAETALLSDLRQLNRFAWLFQSLAPGVEIKPLLGELSERMSEELDYAAEADNQRAFAAGFRNDPEIVVPRVVASAPKVMVTEWVGATPLAEIIDSGTREARDRAGELLATFYFSAPARIHLLHADPHPGNFGMLADGRLCVIDFGATARLPDGIPAPLGRMTRLALERRSDELLELLRREDFLRPGIQVDPEDVITYLGPFTEPVATERFHFTRRWLQRQVDRVGDMRSPNFRTARSLNLPPQYLLVHRVTLGATGILCQLDAEFAMRPIIERWQAGFAE